MHLQQTKTGSRGSGGPQYYFHNVDNPIKEFLRRRGACPVVLMTPYGIASSPLQAVGRDHKLDRHGKVVSGRVGHDRIQQASGAASIGEEIRRWYALPGHDDFERIDVEVTIHPEGHFILSPVSALFRGKRRPISLERPVYPLSLNRRHTSTLWRDQIERIRSSEPEHWAWVCREITRVVNDHKSGRADSIHEADLQRTSGAFSHLGLFLGPYLVRGYDCQSRFSMLRYPEYACPVEIKKRSRGFRYQIGKYDPLPRAVVLCVDHDLPRLPADIDVIELSWFVEHFGQGCR